MNFNDFYWHDSIIENISIQKKNGDSLDTISFDIHWPENGGTASFFFTEVYEIDLKLNGGLTQNETILEAHILDDLHQDVINFYSKWKGMLDGNILKMFVINLNASGGIIKIMAKEFEYKTK